MTPSASRPSCDPPVTQCVVDGISRSAPDPRKHDAAIELLIQKATNITIDNSFGFQNRFYCHTKAGKEDYLAW